MQERYTAEAVKQAIDECGGTYVEKALVEKEGVSPKLSQMADRLGLELASQLLTALVSLRAEADRSDDPAAWYGERSAEVVGGLIAMTYLRGAYTGMLLERRRIDAEYEPSDAMWPRRTHASNRVYRLAGGNEDNDLWVHETADDQDTTVISSVWVPTDEQRERIANGENIELAVWGGQPPVSLGVTDVPIGKAPA